VTLQTVCIRHEPPGVEGDALDEHTRRWTQAVNDSGRAYLTPAIANGQWMTRISIGGENTSLVHVKELWDIVRDAATASEAAKLSS
jgi:aromatic-L-amino-acid/L-tryptophan decarboxylase